jgi:hypothetical protein
MSDLRPERTAPAAPRAAEYAQPTVGRTPPSPPASPDAAAERHLSQRSRLALALLGNAISFGALADALLRVNGLGLNVFIGVLVLVTVLVMLARARDPEQRLRDHTLAIPVLLFAAAFAWRDAESLGAINLLMLVGSMVLWAAAIRWGRHWDVRAAQVREYVEALVRNALSVAAGLAPVLVADVEYAQVSRAVGGRRLVAYVRGALLATPLLFIFGALLSSADPVFARLLGNLVAFDLEEVMGHVVVAGIFAWLAGGYLRGAVGGEPSAPSVGGAVAARPAWSLGIVEVGTVLGSLSALFLMFVLVQLRYFFGGAQLVLGTDGLTYAEYARRGFFELVFVAALSLPLLLGAGALLRREQPRDERLFRGMAGVLLALLHVVMLSAVRRMWLYTSEYGLTEDRLFASAFMGWLFLVFTWFELTVLRGRPRRFAFGALAAAWATGFALNALNPHALIARTNVDRLRAGKRFDARYVGGLSADALPVLLGAVETLRPAARCQLVQALREHRVWGRVSNAPQDWRAWNLGWSAAERARVEHAAAVRWAYGPKAAEAGCALSRDAVSAEGSGRGVLPPPAGVVAPAAAPAPLKERDFVGDRRDVMSVLDRFAPLLERGILESSRGEHWNELFAPDARLVLLGTTDDGQRAQRPVLASRLNAELTPELVRSYGLTSALRLGASSPDLAGDEASVSVRYAITGAAVGHVDASFQLARIGGRWQIVSLLWAPVPRPVPAAATPPSAAAAR